MKLPGEFAVHYETRNHWAVITQLHGSVYIYIWKYCVFNVLMMLLDFFVFDDLMAKHGIKITDKGHTISIFFVAFFCVTRANMALARFNTARSNLGGMLASIRALTDAVASHTMDDQTEAAKAWRNKLAYHSCLTLRVAMAACDFEDKQVMPWDVPEMDDETKTKIMRASQSKGIADQWGYAKRTPKEEAYRVPFVMAQILRMTLYEHKTALEGGELPVGFLLKFNSLIDGFVNSYNAQNKMFTTPMPFPMVQMARTMMFLWVYTLPFALSSDGSTILVHCVVVMLLTYAFMGLETVSLQLDDPFGNDENDFDNLGMAKTVFEDVIRSIDMVDGTEWALKVRASMKGDPAEDKFPSESTSLLV